MSPQGDEQLQRKGISKGACHSAGVTLRDYAHIGNITGDVHASKVRWGAVITLKGGVGFLPPWKQLCRHARNVGWVGEGDECSCQRGMLLRDGQFGRDFKAFKCYWLDFCSY